MLRCFGLFDLPLLRSGLLVGSPAQAPGFSAFVAPVSFGVLVDVPARRSATGSIDTTIPFHS